MENKSIYFVKRGFLSKLFDWYNNKKTSKVRDGDSTTVFLIKEVIDGKDWLVCYIICDVCSEKSKGFRFDFKDRKWKCEKCCNNFFYC